MRKQEGRKQELAIKLEEFRQARRIHGGLVSLGISMLAVKLSRFPIPSKRLRLSVYRKAFGKKYPPGINEAEAEKPLSAYPTLNDLFTRGVKPECRPLPLDTPQLLAPCDGTIQDVGRIANDKILTVKDIEYRLGSLVPCTDIRPFENGHYAIIFLSPIDCHRVFCPHDGILAEAIHVPGYRLLVHPPYQRPEYPVYTLNERMIFRFSTGLGPCLVVMVAGWNVGNISLPFAPQFRPRSKRIVRKIWSPPRTVKRGDWLATFELGSTVVLLAPRAEQVAHLVSVDQKVKYGQPVFTYSG